MPTPAAPSAFWDGEIDPPVEQDADYQFDDQDRAYIDSQIRAIMTRVLNNPAPTPVATPPQYITSTTSKQIVVSGPDQPVDVDTTGGAFSVILPPAASCVEGQVVSVKDNTGAWETNPPGVTVEEGALVQDPQNPGSYVGNGTLPMPKVSGAGAAWVLYKERSIWGLKQ